MTFALWLRCDWDVAVEGQVAQAVPGTTASPGNGPHFLYRVPLSSVIRTEQLLLYH